VDLDSTVTDEDRLPEDGELFAIVRLSEAARCPGRDMRPCQSRLWKRVLGYQHKCVRCGVAYPFDVYAFAGPKTLALVHDTDRIGDGARIDPTPLHLARPLGFDLAIAEAWVALGGPSEGE
jgi:hypothetical protein